MRHWRLHRSSGSAQRRFPLPGHVRYVHSQVSANANDSSAGNLQECNFWDLLGWRRLHRAVIDIGLAGGIPAYANETTSGHRFHSAILLSDRVRVLAHGADRDRFHHVMGWAQLMLPGVEKPLDLRNVHCDPFDPRNRTREVGPLEVLADPARLSLVAGDTNGVGLGFPEPNWLKLPKHLRNGHLLPPSERGEVLVADRGALELLDAAGFADAAVRAGQAHVPTGGFADDDVPRRQDLILASPTVGTALYDYTVHMEPIDDGMSDHAAVSAWLSLSALR
ncbi:hypothetical protein [Streptomyces sp. NPDC051662]|uniref:hypothetical protein n=1 Tax=Streptomyces sp. NPDC051662 TaxID=3154750 RepID=UPI00343C8EC1